MRYDWIVSNPPVHCGQPDDFTVLQVTNRRCPYFTRGTLRGVCTRACVGGSVGGDGCCCRGCCCGGGRRGYVVVAVADADTWRAPASASQRRPLDRRSRAGAPGYYGLDTLTRFSRRRTSANYRCPSAGCSPSSVGSGGCAQSRAVTGVSSCGQRVGKAREAALPLRIQRRRWKGRRRRQLRRAASSGAGRSGSARRLRNESSSYLCVLPRW